MWVYVMFGLVVGGIVLFLLFQWILGINKKKKIKKTKEKFEKDQEIAKHEVVATAVTIIKQNEANLANFVVSIGKHKMVDINNFAKSSISKIQQSTNYDLFFKNEDFPLLEDIDVYLNKLKSTKSNLWDKKCLIEINYFLKQEELLLESEAYKEIKNKTQDLIREELENLNNESAQ